MQATIDATLLDLDGDPVVQLYGCECDYADDAAFECRVPECMMRQDFNQRQWTGRPLAWG